MSAVKYGLKVLLALDQLANALTGGYADETISYRASLANQAGARWGCIFCRVIELVLPDHCDMQKISKAEELSRGGEEAQRAGIPLKDYFHH